MRYRHSKLEGKIMRILMVATALGALSACQTAPEPAMRSADKQATYERLLAGKVAGAPQSCLPSYRSDQMTVIDDNTILFKDGGTVYVNHPPGGCNMLGRGHYARPRWRAAGVARTPA